MKRWHAFYEVLQLPLKMLFLAFLFLGIGNILLNPVFSPYWSVDNQVVVLFAEAITRIGHFLVVYFPFLFFLRLVARKNNGITTILIGLMGYFTFIIFTIFFASPTLPTIAFSSLFGISLPTSQLIAFADRIQYPVQTGMVGVILITITTRLAYQQSRNKSTYGIFAFIDRDMWAMILNFIYSIVAAFVVCIAWQYLFQSIEEISQFIASDISNPINIFVYGVSERVLSVFGLGSFIRSPFWYGSLGGSWINLVGESIAGDVNIWTTMVAQNLVPATAGKFITPYYVLNLFAIPGMIWALFTINTDKIERRRVRLFFILATLLSVFTGTILPLELFLILVCPLLFLFHVTYTGMLFGIFQASKVALGFSYSGSTAVGLPGNLLEFMNFVRNPNYGNAISVVCIVGVISLLIYFLVTRIYFSYLATDLFNNGSSKKTIHKTIEAMGGTANIKMLNASVNRLTIQVFDTKILNLQSLAEFGATKIVENRAGYSIDYGAGSTMIKKGIERQLRAVEKAK